MAKVRYKLYAWSKCGRTFEPVKHGDREKEFCSRQCKEAFQRGERRMVAELKKLGLLGTEAILAALQRYEKDLPIGQLNDHRVSDPRGR